MAKKEEKTITTETVEQKPAEKKAASSVKKVSEVKAAARFIKMSPRKVRLVIDTVRGLTAEQAIQRLKFTNRAAATPVLKLINSAVANAENNFKLDRAALKVKSILANEGPTMKRYRPRAHGRSAAIRKKMSHIEVVLEVTSNSAAPKEEKATIKPVKKTTKKKVKSATAATSKE